MDEASVRFGLPLLAAGQAQKEVLHNEALARVDLLLHPLCESYGDDAPPAAPAEGQSWIVGAAPTGAWTGRGHALASWTAGGWRFTPPVDGLAVRVRSDGLIRLFAAGAWTSAAAIAGPAGGATVDGEARAAIAAMLVVLRGHGLIPA